MAVFLLKFCIYFLSLVAREVDGPRRFLLPASGGVGRREYASVQGAFWSSAPAPKGLYVGVDASAEQGNQLRRYASKRSS